MDLSWNVRDVNRRPWIDDQNHQVWESVGIDIYARDNIGNSLTYEILGLPPAYHSAATWIRPMRATTT